MGDAARKIETPWMRIHEAAEYCRMTKSALQKHVERGHLRPDSRATPGRIRLHRFKRETLDQFLAGEG